MVALVAARLRRVRFMSWPSYLWLTPGRKARRPMRYLSFRTDQPPLSPLPRQDTRGFQSANLPRGFALYSQ